MRMRDGRARVFGTCVACAPRGLARLAMTPPARTPRASRLACSSAKMTTRAKKHVPRRVAVTSGRDGSVCVAIDGAVTRERRTLRARDRRDGTWQRARRVVFVDAGASIDATSPTRLPTSRRLVAPSSFPNLAPTPHRTLCFTSGYSNTSANPMSLGTRNAERCLRAANSAKDTATLARPPSRRARWWPC